MALTLAHPGRLLELLGCFTVALRTQRAMQSTLGAGVLNCYLGVLRVLLVSILILCGEALVGGITGLATAARLLPVSVLKALRNKLIAKRELQRAASLGLGLIGLLRVLGWGLCLVVLVGDVQILNMCFLVLGLLP